MLALAGLGTTVSAGELAHQGSIKFDFRGRYDTVLTGTDSLLFKLTLVEFHRKLAYAGYAAYFWRDPSILARYVDVQAESIAATTDSLRAIVLAEIADEIRRINDSAFLSRIALHQILFQTDTMVEIKACTPLREDGGESPEVTYTLHKAREKGQWWVFATASGSEMIVYRDYVALPDEEIKEILR